MKILKARPLCKIEPTVERRPTGRGRVTAYCGNCGSKFGYFVDMAVHLGLSESDCRLIWNNLCDADLYGTAKNNTWRSPRRVAK